MLFVPFLVFFLFASFLQIPISEQSPRASKKANAVAKLSSHAKANNETIDLHEHGISKGGEYGVDLLKDMFILLLDMIDTNRDGHVTRRAVDVFVGKMNKNVDTSETSAADGTAKAGVKLLKRLLDDVWPYMYPEHKLRCSSKLDKSEALEDAKDGLNYFFTHGDKDRNGKLTHKEVEKLLNLLKDEGGMCRINNLPGGSYLWVCKKKMYPECEYRTEPEYTFGGKYPWNCVGQGDAEKDAESAKSAAAADGEKESKKSSLVKALQQMKCGLGAFFVN